MTVRILNSKTISNNTSADLVINLTGGNQPVAGRKLYVLTNTWNGVGVTVVDVTDNKSNAYSRKDNSTASSNTRAMIWGCDYSGTGDCSVTVDINNASGVYMTVSIIEVDDLITTENDTGARGASQGNTSGVDPSATGAGNTAQANNLLLSTMGDVTGDSTANVTVPSGWTSIMTESNGAANLVSGCAYKYITAVETPTAQWSIDDNADSWQCVIVALKQVTTDGPKKGLLMGVG
jgi:hypothetical protein